MKENRIKKEIFIVIVACIVVDYFINKILLDTSDIFNMLFEEFAIMNDNTNLYINNNSLNIIFWILPIVFVCISILIWRIFGKDDKVIETVEFYPPEGFNSLEVGYLYKGRAEKKDVISLIIYLANKGYLEIEEIEENESIAQQKYVKITKLKEYNGDNEIEKIFLNRLFRYGETEIELSDLNNRFYTTINSILRKVNNSINKEMIFKKSSSKPKKIILAFIIIAFTFINFKTTIGYGQIKDFISAVLFSIAFPIFLKLILSRNLSLYVKGVVIFVAAKYFCLPWITNVLPVFSKDILYVFICLVCIAIMFVINNVMLKRTNDGNEILQKIKGFKKFLETAEKDRINQLVEENPTYFYDILPYAYVLDVSNEWIKNFEIIGIQNLSLEASLDDLIYCALQKF